MRAQPWPLSSGRTAGRGVHEITVICGVAEAGSRYCGSLIHIHEQDTRSKLRQEAKVTAVKDLGHSDCVLGVTCGQYLHFERTFKAKLTMSSPTGIRVKTPARSAKLLFLSCTAYTHNEEKTEPVGGSRSESRVVAHLRLIRSILGCMRPQP